MIKDISKINSNTIWHLIIKNNRSDIFWIDAIDKYNIEQLWKIQGPKGYSVWHLLVLYIKSDIFWNKVIDKKLYKSWSEPGVKGDTVWHFIVQSEKTDFFWKEVF
jgi:hypothetical protein